MHLGLVLEFLLGLTGLSNNSRTHAAALIMVVLQYVLTSGRDSFISSLPIFVPLSDFSFNHIGEWF